jgi:hypothetical protein
LHGGGFKFHFNLLRNVIGHFFVLVFIDHQARSVPRRLAPCVPLGGSVASPRPVGVSCLGRRPGVLPKKGKGAKAKAKKKKPAALPHDDPRPKTQKARGGTRLAGAPLSCFYSNAAPLCFRSDSSCFRRFAIAPSAGSPCSELWSWICPRGVRSL